MVGGGAYLLGHTDREQRRLAGQAALIGPDTEALFRDAGLCPGCPYWTLAAASETSRSWQASW